MARDHHGDRVGAQRVAHCAGATWCADLEGDLAIARHRAVGDPGRPAQHLAGEISHQRPVQGHLEILQLPGEVPVELAAHRVETARRLEDARRQLHRDLPEHLIAVLVLERDTDKSLGRGHEEERADRAVHGRDRHVDEALGLRALEKSVGQRWGDGHWSSLLSFFNPSCTLWRAESCVVDIAAAISG